MKFLIIIFTMIFIVTCSSAPVSKERAEELRLERLLKKLQSQGLY